LISRTLGKVALIDHAYQGPKPCEGEFWLSDVVSETKASQVGGCFLVEPFQKVEYEDLVPISPLNCTINQIFDSILIIDPVRLETPERTLIPWILTLNHKAKLMRQDIVAIIMNLGGSWWTRRL
jgi:hypothetical protein